MDREKPTVRPGPRASDGLRTVLRRLPAYVYLEDLFRGRHIVEIGCGDGAGAHHLASAGAASVIALDRSPASIDVARARYRLANLTFGVSDFGTIDLEDGTVDVICVSAGEELARWPAFLQEARRVLARGGMMVVQAASGDRAGVAHGVGFHDLIGRLAPLFGPARMIGVTPFVGFAVVEYSDGGDELDIELDTTLAEEGGGRAPITDYVAVCGASTGPARGYMVVEVPMVEGLEAVRQAHGLLAEPERQERPAVAERAEPPPPEVEIESEPTHGGRGDDAELRRRLSRAMEERTGAEAEVHALRTRLGQAEEEIGRVAAQAARELGEARRSVHVAHARNEALAAQLAEVRRELELARETPVPEESDELRERIAELEDIVAAREDELSSVRLETAPMEVMVRAAEQHEAEMRERLAELAERDAYLEELRQELEDVAGAERAAAEAAREVSGRAAELEVEARELRGRLSSAEGELLRLHAQPSAPAVPVVDPRVAELEAALAERSAAADKAAARWKEAEAKTDELWKKIGEMQKELASSREQAVENARAQRQAAQIALTRAVEEASKKLVSSQDQSIRTERERQELEKEVLTLRPLRAELEASRGRAGELERELEASRALAGELEASRARTGELERELETARAHAGELEASRARTGELERELETARAHAGELDASRARTGELERELEAARGQVSDLEAVRGRAADLEGQLDAARAERVELQALRQQVGDLEQLRQQVDELEGLRARAVDLERDLETLRGMYAERERVAAVRQNGTPSLEQVEEQLRALAESVHAEEQALAGLVERITAVAAAVPQPEEPA